MIAVLKNFHQEESGQDLIEYALIALMIALALVTSLTSVATGLSTQFSTFAAQL